MTDPAIQLLLWEAGLQFLVVMLAGVILGLFASAYLKRRDEVTRDTAKNRVARRNAAAG